MAANRHGGGATELRSQKRAPGSFVSCNSTSQCTQTDLVKASVFAFTRREGGVSKQHEISTQEPAMQSNSRAHSALIGIYEISKLLTRPSRLEIALSGVINLLASFLDMNNGLIALLDEQDRTSTVVGAGWSEADRAGAF